MPARDPFAAFTAAERAELGRLDAPWKVQDFLDAIPYTTDKRCRSPRGVLRDRTAHCFEGALFAAAALGFHGYPMTLVDLRALRDDDHVLMVFRRHGAWGAVAKSNFVGLRYREPLFGTVRDLALSYFEDYFNTLNEKSLREFSRPFNLARCRGGAWLTAEDDLDDVGEALDRAPHVKLLTPAQARGLRAVDPRAVEAGSVGTDPTGVFQARR